MEDKDLNTQADDTLALIDPEQYVLSNPSPRDWNLTVPDIARSVRIPLLKQSQALKEYEEANSKLNMVETAGTAFWDRVKNLPESISSSIDITNIDAYSSANMSQEEADRILEDALYTRSVGRQAKEMNTASKIKYNTLYNISGAVGDLIKYAALGIVGGLPTVAAVAGAEAFAETEAGMVDSYIDKYGTISGYAKERDKDLALAGAYGAFSGLTEVALGVERIAAGALGRYSRIEAASRLARQQGQLYKSAALKAGRRFGMSAVEEGGEEFIQSLGEDVANYWAGYEDAVFTDENFKKALTAAAYGALIGGPAGWGLYRINRQSLINKINDWNNRNQLGMTQQQIVESTDQILDDSRSTMVEEIATRTEIRNQYGKAFDLIKSRIKAQIEATGTTPWTDETKTIDDYVQTVAQTITVPAILQANELNIPLNEFLELADVNASVLQNVAYLEPISSVEDLDAIIAKQTEIIAEQREAKKLGVGDDDVRQTAERRKALAQKARRQVLLEEGLLKKRKELQVKQLGYDPAKRADEDIKHLKDSESITDFTNKIAETDSAKAKQRYSEALLKWVTDKDSKLFDSLLLNNKVNAKILNVLESHGKEIYDLVNKYPEAGLKEDIYNALKKMQIATPENFVELTNRIPRDRHDVIGENVLVWHWLFADVSASNQFMGSLVDILTKNQEDVKAGKTMFDQPVAPLSKKDAVIQALEKTDQAMSDLATSRGREYESLFTEETREIKNPQLLAAVISSQNQYAFQPALNMLNQADLANENARLDDIYPAYEGETIDIDGKERTVYNSNGDRIAKSKEALRNFYKWFGDSKVVDEQGRPLVVYHGTNAEFDTFDTKRIGKQDYGFYGKGFYFTENKYVAEDYAKSSAFDEGEPIVMPVYLNLKNPFFMEYTNDNGISDEKHNRLVEQGYDGVIAIESRDLRKEGYEEELNKAKALNVEHWQLKDYEGNVVGRILPFEYVAWEQNQIKSVDNRGTYSDKTGNIYLQRRAVNGFYDPELSAIALGKSWNETTLVHEFHHRYLEKIFNYYKQAQDGRRKVTQKWLDDTNKLFNMIGVDPKQTGLTTVQQERFATMVEAYITGLGVENQDNIAFQSFLHWVPEKYKSIMNIGYLDENGKIQNPMLDQESVDFFNRWFASPLVPSLPSAPDAQRLVNVTDSDNEIIPSSQKEMNNREKEWGQDSEIQNKADSQLWRAIGENNPTDLRAAIDGQEELNKARLKEREDDRILPERQKWFKTGQKDARTKAAEAARKYLEKNPEHARELAFADPETMAKYDAPVDHGMLIRAVMETVEKGSDEWYILDDNLATVKSMSGSTLSLSGDLSHQAYLDAKREVEAARELKAAVNYAGTRRGAMEKWNADIKAFVAKRTAQIIATEANSQERKIAIKAFLEEAKTKFSANTTNAILNQLDLTGYNTKSSQVFIKWAEKQIRQAAHAKIDTKEQAELMKASVKAQLAMEDINSTEEKDGLYSKAVAAAKDIRHWQFVKDKMKKAYIGKWGRFGVWVDNLFGSYMPSAMLMSVNTLFVANIPSTAINTGTIRLAAKSIGENKVNKSVQEGEIKRIKQIFNASGMNLAQMEKPTSPSLMHGEKYTNQEQSHWYNFTFDILSKEDNIFRVPTFVDALSRIATKNANGDSAKATQLFKEYIKLGNKDEEAMMARKQALTVANMAVFTQDGIMASSLNHIRSQLNNLSRGLLGLEPGGFGLGNVLAPFLKTGANIVEMGLSATLAPAKLIPQGIKKLRGKEFSDLDKIAIRADWMNLAWTAVGVALLAAINDDDWYTEPYEVGHRYDPNKPYDSIKIGGVWVKLDIFGPMEITLRTAAMAIKNWEKRKLASVGDGLWEAVSDIPLVNQVTDSPLEYATKYPDKWVSSLLYNQANKFVPAMAKPVIKATSRATDAELDVSGLGKTIERKFHRNYGLDGEQLTTNDLIQILTNRLKTNPE